MATKPKRLARRAAYALVAAVVALGVLEAAAALMVRGGPTDYRMYPARDNDLFRADPLLFWTLRPDAVRPEEDIRINAAGFRGAPIGSKKQGVARIVCLGDSVTFGFKVREEESYPALLRDELAGTHRVEVVNVGVPGYSSLQGRRQFQRDTSALKPDLLIVSLGNNDILDSAIPDSRRPVYGAFTFTLRETLMRTHWGRYMAQVAAERESGATCARCTPEETRHNLRMLARLADGVGGRAVFFHPLHARPADMKLPVASTPEDVAVIEVAPAFVAARAAERPLFQPDENHPTAAGYRLLTAQIADFLRAGDWLAGYER